MTKYRWLCQPVQPSVPTPPAAPAHPSYIIDSALPPVSGDDYAAVQAERDDLRRQLDRMQDTIAARTSDADALRGVLAACREVIGAVDNAALYDACADNADLRRQVAEAQAKLAAVPRASISNLLLDAATEYDRTEIDLWLTGEEISSE